jgi:hypothetical protein
MTQSNTYSLDNIVQVGNWAIYVTGAALFKPRLLQSLLSSNKVMKDNSVSGTLMKPLDELREAIVQAGGRLVVERKSNDFVYVWDDFSYLDVDFNKKTNIISVAGTFTDPRVGELIELFDKEYVSKVKKNLIYSIIQTSSGLEIKNMGDGSSALIKENYLPEVLEDIDYVAEAFGKTPPGGRICILNGEPGTGKTHLIRSFLTRMDCVFLIIPTNLIDSLDKPQFLPLLLSVKESHEKPIIMIIEDGDACLVPRKSDNISTIGSLLNLSDGILGAIIDIKMIISTNAEIKEIDHAILRPGRLCRNIHVGPLPYDRANKVYQRLINSSSENLEFRKFYTLAEVYDKVNNTESNIISSSRANVSKRVIGFSNAPMDATVNRGGLDVK